MKAEQEARRAAEEVERRKAEEAARREAEDAAQKLAEEQARQRAEAEARAREEAEAQARRQAEQAARLAAEEQAKKEAQEQARIKAREAARRVAEEVARREAEAKAKQEAELAARLRAEEVAQMAAEARARREAEEAARRLAEEQERQRAEAERRAREEAEARAREEAEAQARRQAEEAARLAAEERARREAEAQAQKEERERAKREAEEAARQKAEEKARQKAEEKARKEAEAEARRLAKEREQQAAQEAARQKAEEAERLKAEKAAAKEAEKAAKEAEKAGKAAAKEAEKAAQEAAKQARQEEAHAPVPPEAAPAQVAAGVRLALPFNVGRLVRLGALATVVLAVAGLGLLHVIPFNGRLAQVEQAASTQFGQPVKIGGLNFALFPRPHWRLQQVSIGDQGQIAIPQVNAGVSLGSLFAEALRFQSVELLSPVVNDEGMGWLLFGQARNGALQPVSLSASEMKLRSQHVQLPAFAATAEFGEDGGWRKIVLDAGGEKIRIDLQRTDGAPRFELTARALTLPFGGAPTFDTLNASGTIRPDALEVSKFSGVIHDGTVTGEGMLRWTGGWSLKGEAQARQIDPVRLMPALVQGGALHGSFKYEMQAAEAGKLFDAAQARGSFTLANGALLGVDLASLVMGQAGSGRSSFNEVSGDFAYAAGKTQLSRMRLTAGVLSAAGDAAADANSKLSGRFAIDLRTASRQARANLEVGGTLAAPQFSR